MKSIFKLFVLIFLCFNLYSANFQQTLFKFRYLTIDQGLSHNNTRVFSQDSSGYIWIATQNGLNKYNGYEVINYWHDPSDTNSILSNDVNFVFTDSKNNVWVGTKAGLNIYNREKDNFIKFIPGSINNEISSSADMDEDRQGNLWIATNNGLYSYNQTTNTFQHYPLKNNIGQKPATNSVIRLHVAKDNKIWCSFSSNGISIFNSETNIYRHFINEKGNYSSISDNKIERIYQDSKGNIWVGTFNGGLNLFNPIDSIFKRIEIDKNNSFSTRVRAMFEFDNNFYVGTRGGIYLFNKKINTFSHIAHTYHPYSILNMNSILVSYKDKQGGLWLGTHSGGVNYTNLYRKPFANFEAKKDNPYFLNNGNVFALLEYNGYIYIGTEGGMSVLNRKTGKFKYFVHDPDDPNSISHNDIKCLELDKNNNIWIGTNKGGLLQYNPKTKKFFNKIIHDPDNINSISSNKVYSLYNDINGNIWIVTSGDVESVSKNIDVFNPVTRQFKHLNQKVSSAFSGNKDHILIGATNGFWEYKYATDSFKFYRNDSLIGLTYTILEDSKNNIWIGGKKGLVLYNPDLDIYKNYSVKTGYPFYVIFGILEDNEQNLWISSSSGLIKFENAVNNNDSKTLRVFDQQDGLQSKQFNYGAYYKNNSGEMFFGGIKGFNTFFPEQIKNNPFYPEVVFTKLKINNKLVEIGKEINGRIVLQKAFSETKQITLIPKDINVSFEFAAIHFAEPGKNRYKYLMEGFDNEWHETDATRNFVTYTNLPHGEFTFKLLASNSDGLWTKNPIELKVKVLPPFWKTWWFIVIASIAILGIIFTIYYVRINRIKAQNELLERKVERRTSELKEANIELQERQEEILAQNEEIQQQSEELAAQRDSLEEQNEEIKTKSEEISKAYDSIRVLSEFGQNLTSTLNLDDINNIIYEYVSSLMDTSAFGIGLYNHQAKCIEFKSFMEKGKRTLPFFNYLDEENSLSVWCLKKNKVILINDFKIEYKKYINSINKYKTTNIPQSCIYVPLLIENRPIGVVTVQSYNKNAYADKDLNSLLSLASYITIAIENANVYEIINKQNTHIKSSIEYARNIQNSILPIQKNVEKHFETFILYRPKDIVSGDFYWFTTLEIENKEYYFMAVVDCTGHGVPGAFMSLIGNRILNDIVNQKKIINPAQILELLNANIQVTLKQDQTNNNDGMDVCLARLEKLNNSKTEIVYSGAKRPLYYTKIKDDKLLHLNGVRKSIGGIRAKRSKLFYTNQKIVLNKNEILYFTSDGMADQNRPDRKKFGTLKLLKLLNNNKHLPLNEQKEIIESTLLEFMQNEEQRDDITIIGLKT